MIHRISLIAALAFALAAAPALACKYNVRDVGFVDTGARPYALRLRPGGAYDDAKLIAIANDVLADSNVKPEISGAPGDAQPSANLVHPDSRELPIPLDVTDNASIRRSLEPIVNSSRRSALRGLLPLVHSIILIIPGDRVDSEQRMRPDCWISTIPAGGMVLSPGGGGGCSCGSWMETSLGFMPIAPGSGVPTKP